VPSDQVKISESCFVWVAPTLLRGGPYLEIEEQPFECLQEVQILTRHVYYHEMCGTAEGIYFHLYPEESDFVE
jgi:hypothetical protein